MKYYELLREAEQAMGKEATRLVNASYSYLGSTGLPEKYSGSLDEALRLLGLGRQQLRLLADLLERQEREPSESTGT